MKDYDLIIIGWGKGGKTLAGEAAARGEKIAMVERSKQMYGGTCINVGCIPSKFLVAAANDARRAAPETFEGRAALYQEAIAEKRKLTAALRQKMYSAIDGYSNADIYDGVGSLVSRGLVKVACSDGEKTISGRRIVIDTGSAPVIPSISGADSARVHTSETLMELDELPKRLAIIGGGFIALEFASIYSGFGSDVTIFQRGKTFLPDEDADIALEIAKVLEAGGVKIVAGAAPKGIKTSGDKAVLEYVKDGVTHEFECDAILMAAGRRPNTADLNAENAGLALGPDGAVAVDEFLRASAPNVWVMGDANGGPKFTYVSLDDSRIVGGQIFGKGGNYSTKKRGSVPYSVFVTPPFSRVGLTEREALNKGCEIKVAKMPAAAIPKAQVMRQTTGLLKAVVDAKTGMILGASLFCAESHEMINIIKLAMDFNLPYTVLRDRIYTHPTMTETLNVLFAQV